jgi:Kef-type K+ transport system membrane component KefB
MIILGLIMWAWMSMANNSGPSDGPGSGLLMISLIFLAIYYFIMTAWTWRIIQQEAFGNDLKNQFILIFTFGMVIPAVSFVVVVNAF